MSSGSSSTYGARVVDPNVNNIRAHADFGKVAGFVSTHLTQYQALIKSVVDCTKALESSPRDWQNWGSSFKLGIDAAVTLGQDWDALNLPHNDLHAEMIANVLEDTAINNPHALGDGTALKGILQALQGFLKSPLGQTLTQALLNLLLGSLGGIKPPVTP